LSVVRRRDVLLTAALCLSSGVARAQSSPGDTVADLKDLAAPAARTEVRLDLGVLAAASARQDRAELRVEIAPRPDFWYGIGVSSIAQTSTSTSMTVGSDPTVTTTSTSDSFSLSARVFKRIGPLVLSAGLVDGRGGAGLELRSPYDRLRLELLASEWRPSDPRAIPSLRAGASAQWRWIYVQGGVLDLLDRQQRSAYLGLGMRWRDEDHLRAARGVLGV
jgi:phospholipid/cholesterol/gamma-HCH transport system substrate-binding protein